MLNLLVRVVVLVVFKFLVNIIKLERELVDVTRAVSNLTTCCVESVDDLIH